MRTRRDRQRGPESRRRHLSVAMFVVVVVAYLAILVVIGQLIGVGDVGRLGTRHRVVVDLLVPIGASALFVIATITYLGWWAPVLADDRPVQRWVWTIPVVFFLASIAAINYGGLSGRGVGFVLLLALAAVCVGIAEEGMFRGIDVVMLRDNGFPEARVALWSSVIFGAVHLINSIGTGAGAIGQAFAVSFAGYFFYLTRRVSKGLLIPILVHGLFDFSLLSGTVTAHRNASSAAAVLAYIICAVLLVARRHHIEPEAAA